MSGEHEEIELTPAQTRVLSLFNFAAECDTESGCRATDLPAGEFEATVRHLITIGFLSAPHQGGIH